MSLTALAISSWVIGISSQIALAESHSRSRCCLQPEDLAAVAADALEHAVAVEQAVIVDADLGVFFVVELAGDVDFQRHGPRGRG